MTSTPTTPPLQPTPNSGVVRGNNPSYAVEEFHNRDDLDRDNLAHHHTLGYRPGQAAPGTELLRYIPAGVSGVLAINQSIASGVFTTITNWSGSFAFNGASSVPAAAENVLQYQGFGIWKVMARGWFVLAFTWDFAVGPGTSYGGHVVNGVRSRSTGAATDAYGACGNYYWEGILNTGDLVGFQVFHNAAGANLLVGDVGGGDYRSFYSMRRVAVL